MSGPTAVLAVDTTGRHATKQREASSRRSPQAWQQTRGLRRARCRSPPRGHRLLRTRLQGERRSQQGLSDRPTARRHPRRPRSPSACRLSQHHGKAASELRSTRVTMVHVPQGVTCSWVSCTSAMMSSQANAERSPASTLLCCTFRGGDSRPPIKSGASADEGGGARAGVGAAAGRDDGFGGRAATLRPSDAATFGSTCRKCSGMEEYE